MLQGGKVTIRVGIIGLGKMGMLHYGNFNSIEDAKVVAACESNKKIRRYSENIIDIPVHAEFTKLNKKNVDSVIICVPNKYHSEIGTYFAKMGVHVFIEKPLTDTVHSARKLVDVAKKSKIVNQVGFFNRFASVFLKGKEILDNEILGELYHTKAVSYEGLVFTKQKGWRQADSGSGGGALLDIGSHIIDILYWYFGDVERVYGIGKNAYSNVDDFFSAVLEFKNGMSCSMDTTWSAHGYRQMYLELVIEGSNGMMKLTDDYVKLYLKDSVDGYEKGWTTIYRVDLYEPTECLLGVQPAFFEEDKHFIDCCIQRRGTSADWATGLKVQEILEAIMNSSKSKKPSAPGVVK